MMINPLPDSSVYTIRKHEFQLDSTHTEYVHLDFAWVYSEDKSDHFKNNFLFMIY